MLFLGIETSCDETGVALLKEGRQILSNLLASQEATHGLFGGVVPELASRAHLRAITGLVEGALQEAQVPMKAIEAVAVTQGPGLVGSLLVGLSLAKAMSYSLQIPLVPVNHIEAHIYANFLTHPDLSFPFVALVVSGGHTELIYCHDHGEYKVLGRTRDDAAGESFDKVAKLLGLPYPGGPPIEKMAQEGDPEALHLPRPMTEQRGLNFSFSGLKTAVLYALREKYEGRDGPPWTEADLCASFQQAVAETLALKSQWALEETGAQRLVGAGGVMANSLIRSVLKRATEGKAQLFFPPPHLCLDNGAMVACAGYYLYTKKGRSAALNLNADPSLKL